MQCGWFALSGILVLGCGLSVRHSHEQPPDEDVVPTDDGTALILSDLPPCTDFLPVPLAQTRTASPSLALDADAVYFAGSENTLSKVPKQGGAVVLLGPAFSPTQVAVDADSVYAGSDVLHVFAKNGGTASTLFETNVFGVAVTQGYVYAVQHSSRADLVRWSRDSGLETVEAPPDPNQLALVNELVADDAFVYVVPQQTAGTSVVHRVRVSNGLSEPLMEVVVAQGVGLGGGFLYVAEESTQSVKRVRLSDQRVTTFRHFGRTPPGGGSTLESYDRIVYYPTRIAADSEHVYLNLQALRFPPYDTIGAYEGHLIRFATDGAEACELASPIDYGCTPAIDDQAVYFIADGQVLSISK